MAPVNVTECDVEDAVSQQADITALTKKSDDSQFPDTSFLDLPFEVQCHILRQISAADIRQLKEVSKELKWLIERSWRPAFYILPPNVQIRILTKTQMTSSEIRRMKLVSKDMSYLIERGGRHLTKKELRNCRINEITPGSYKVTSINNYQKQHISLENFSQILAHSHILTLHMYRVNVKLDFCDEMQHLRNNNIFCKQLNFTLCNFNDKEKLTVIDRLLRTTEASELCIFGNPNEKHSFTKEFFRMPSVRNLKKLCMSGASHFCDDDLIAGNYRRLSLKKCPLSEHGLRRILEEVLNCRREIVSYEFKIQKKIDVDRLLDGLPNIQTTKGQQWRLQNIKGQNIYLRIVDDCFSFSVFKH